MVGTLTLKLVTPAGTVMMPPARLTPLEKVGALVKSLALALPPPREKAKVVATLEALDRATL